MYTYVSRYLAYKQLAFLVNEQHIEVKTGSFTVETLVTKRPKLIELEFSNSAMQRCFHIMDVNLVSRAQPIRLSKLQDIDAALYPLMTEWFEACKFDVRMDERFQDGALKKSAVIHFVKVLKTIEKSRGVKDGDKTYS